MGSLIGELAGRSGRTVMGGPEQTETDALSQLNYIHFSLSLSFSLSPSSSPDVGVSAVTVATDMVGVVTGLCSSSRGLTSRSGDVNPPNSPGEE